LHIPMTKEIHDADLNEVRNVVGVDFGLNFLATTFDSKDQTVFSKVTISKISDVSIDVPLNLSNREEQLLLEDD
jgi:hypothetical protein